MIIPEKYRFKSSDDAKRVMSEFIRDNFGDILGAKVGLLSAPNGIDLIQKEVDVLMAAKGLRSSSAATQEELRKAA